MEPLHVFISSTWTDMLAERAAVEAATLRMRSVRFVGMEHFGARNASTYRVSLDEVDHCQIYVGIVGCRWGSGITHAEYKRALEKGLSCLIYQKVIAGWSDTESVEDASRLSSWVQELRDRHTVANFASAEELASRVVADLHNLVLDRHLIQGIGRLKTDYEARIQRFLAEYVGTSDAPVPFGGRTRELGELNRWLDDDNGTPYLMLGGPAGRGKSALLVNWARGLALSRPDLALVYFPISIRFRTNLAVVAYASITARLAAVHDEPLLAGPDTPPEVWRELMAAAMRRPLPDGRMLLLLIDGADEAGDWHLGPDLFPRSPQPGLRIVVSARYLAGDVDSRGWIERLGWNRSNAARSVDLTPLTAGDLVDVLRQTSLPLELLSARADVVAELFRLSSGDPLLINLYVADLWARGEEVSRLKPEDLPGLLPGLSGYFRRWWEDQRLLWGNATPMREPTVTAVLNMLACALGPLQASELLELLPVGESLSVWALDEVMQSLRRYVVGDGQVQGYAFTHPRLGDYFHERLIQAGRGREQDLRFATWGARCLSELSDGRRTPADMPGYLLSFLRAHLDRAGSPADAYLGLVSNAWALAWDRIDKGSFAGFLIDLRHVREILAQADDSLAARGHAPRYLAAELRIALAACSVGTQAAEMSAPLLVTLVQRGIWSPSQAIAYATRIPRTTERLRCLVGLVSATSDSDRPLALAVALTELRVLLAPGPGLETLRSTVHEMLEDRDGSIPALRPLPCVVALLRLARQGLDERQRDTLLETLGTLVDNRRGTAESQAAILHRMHLEGDRKSADPQSGHLMYLRAYGAKADPAMAAQRLALLLPNLAHGEHGRLHEALVAATTVVTASVVCHAGLEDAQLPALLAAWRLLPLPEMQHSVAAVAPHLTAAQCEHVVAEIRRLPVDEPGVEALHVLLDAGPKSARALVARGIVDVWLPSGSTLAAATPDFGVTEARVDLRLSWTGDAHVRRLAAACASLPSPERVGLLPSLTDVLAPADCLVFCGALLRLSGGSDEAGSLTAALALKAASRLSDAGQCDEILAELIDWLNLDGRIDPLEAWRPRSASRSLRAGLRQVVQLGQVPATTLRSLALSLATVDVARSRDALATLDGQVPAAQAYVAQDSSPKPLSLAVSGDAPLAVQLASEAREVSVAKSLLYALDALRAAIAGDHAAVVREAVGLLLQSWVERGFQDLSTADLLALPTRVADGPMWPPAAGTLEALDQIAVELWSRQDVAATQLRWLLLEAPLPEAVRQPLLNFALVRASASDTPEDHQMLLPLAVARMGHPTDSLVARALAALRRWQSNRPRRSLEVLEAILPVVRAATLPIWLEVAAQAEDFDVARWLDRLRHEGLVDDASFGSALVESIGRLVSPRHRADWFVRLAGSPVLLPAREALAVARAIQDGNERLRALCAVLPLQTGTHRSEGLAEALLLATRLGDRQATARALVQMAVDTEPRSPSLLEAATTAAVGISDRGLRGEALANVAAVLPEDVAAAAAASSRHIGDAAARVRAMCALVGVCASFKASAQSAVQTAIAALPRTADRSAATLYAGSLLPQAERWVALAAAMPAPGEVPVAFEPAEVLGSLADSLQDAPTKLQMAALAWMNSLPESTVRSSAVVKLLPSLSPGARLAGLAQLGDSLDEALKVRLTWLFSATENQALLALADQSPVGTRHLRAVLRPSDPSPFDPVILTDLCEALKLASNDVARATAARELVLARDLDGHGRRLLADSVLSIGDRTLRDGVVRCLAAFASDGNLTRAASAVAAISDSHDRAVAGLRLAHRQAGRLRSRGVELALSAALSERDPVKRVRAAIECAHNMPELVPAALVAVDSLAEDSLRIEAICSLWRGLPDEYAAKALSSGLKLLRGDLRIRWLVELAERAEAKLAVAILGHISSIELSSGRARVLVPLLPRLADEQRADAEAIVDAMIADAPRLAGLAALAARWPESFSEACAQRAADLMRDLRDELCVTAHLQSLTPIWPVSGWRYYVRAAECLTPPETRCSLICHALRFDPTSAVLRSAGAELTATRHRALVMGAAASTGSAGDLAALEDVLGELGQQAPAMMLDACVEIVRSSGRMASPVFCEIMKSFRARPRKTLQALRDVAPSVTREQATAILEAQPWAELPRLERECCDLLIRLSPAMVDCLPAVIEAASNLKRPAVVARLLCEIAPLIEDEMAQVAALTAAMALDAPGARVEALIGLTPRMAVARQHAVIEALALVRGTVERSRCLRMIRPLLSSAALPVWQAAVEAIGRLDLAFTATEDAAASNPTNSVDDEASGTRFTQTVDRLLRELSQPAVSRDQPTSIHHGTSGAHALLDRLARMDIEDDRVTAIQRQLPHLNSSDRRTLIEAMPKLLGAGRYDRMLPMVAAGLADVDQSVLVQALRGVFHDVRRFGSLASSLITLFGLTQRQALLALCRDFLQTDSVGHRNELLARIQMAAPLLALLGGDDTAIDSIKAIDDAGRLWQ